MTGLGGAPTLYAFTLGLVAAVNPCGFPLLPAFLAVGAADAAPGPLVGRLVRALGSGLAVSVGFLVVFGGIGLAVEEGTGLPTGWLPWVMIPVGALCVVAGVVALAGRRIPVPALRRAPMRGRGRLVGSIGFGLAYAVASLGCEAPIFLTGVVGPFVHRGTVVGLAGGVAFALGMGLVVCAVALAGAGAGRLRLGPLRAAQPILNRIAGGVLVLVGGYLVVYWTASIVDPLGQPAPVRVVEAAANDLASWLAVSPKVTGVVMAAVVVLVLAAAALRAAAASPPAAPASRSRQVDSAGVASRPGEVGP